MRHVARGGARDGLEGHSVYGRYSAAGSKERRDDYSVAFGGLNCPGATPKAQRCHRRLAPARIQSFEHHQPNTVR